MASANSEAPTSAQPLGVNEEPSSTSQPDATSIPDAEKPKPLRPLTSVNWPYAPEESAFPDPLKRDDPKDLQLHHYEAIGMPYTRTIRLFSYFSFGCEAMSGKIREIFNKHENLPALLTSIDRLRGIEREEALQKALGVTPPDIDDWRKRQEPNEEVLALRELAEAVENAIRGGNDAALGLNWEDES
jgi:hypothetical protein